MSPRRQMSREHTSHPRPLSERHEAIRAELGPIPYPASVLGRRLGISGAQATTALYVLQARGMAERLPGKGWRQVDGC